MENQEPELTTGDIRLHDMDTITVLTLNDQRNLGAIIPIEMEPGKTEYVLVDRTGYSIAQSDSKKQLQKAPLKSLLAKEQVLRDAEKITFSLHMKAIRERGNDQDKER